MYSQNGQQDIEGVSFGILYKVDEINNEVVFAFEDVIAARLDELGYKSTKLTILSSVKNINDLIKLRKVNTKSMEEIIHFIEQEINVEAHYNQHFGEFIHGSMLMVFQHV